MPPVARHTCSCPAAGQQRGRLPGTMAGQQQQGEQLRPAVGRGGAHPQDRGHVCQTWRSSNSLDVMTFLDVEKAIIAQSAGSGPSTADTINAEACGPSPHAGRPVIGPRSPCRPHRVPTPGPPCGLRRPRGGGRLVRTAEPLCSTASTSRRRAMYRAYETELYPLRPTVPALLRGR